MSEQVLWALIAIVVVPIAVLAAAEVDERLRQRDSTLRGAVGILRTWALPIFALWVVMVPVLARPNDSLGVQLVSSALVLAVAAFVLQVLRVLVARLAGRPRSDGRGPIPQLLLAVPRLVTLLVVAWVLLSNVWGVNLSAALTALGVTSLVVSFALQDTLSGLASGFLLLSDQPFQPGEWIQTGEDEGVVVDINWRTTRIRTRNGDLLVVPNSTLAKANIMNYTAPTPVHRVVVPVQVAFSNPPTVAKQMLLAAAEGTAGVLADPPPNVRVVVADDPLMGYEVDMWVDDYSIVPRVLSDFNSLVWYQSHRHGVPLPSPAQDLYLHDSQAEAEAARPDPASIRAGLLRSPLLSMLDDDDIDRLVPASRKVRFAAGELMVESAGATRDLLVVVEGRGRMILLEPNGQESIIGDIDVGDTVGVLEGPRGSDRVLAVRAVTDCDVMIIEANAASDVTSRNAELAAAFNRLRQIRSRRLERLLTGRTGTTVAASDDGRTSAPEGPVT